MEREEGGEEFFFSLERQRVCVSVGARMDAAADLIWVQRRGARALTCTGAFFFFRTAGRRKRARRAAAPHTLEAPPRAVK